MCAATARVADSEAIVENLPDPEPAIERLCLRPGNCAAANGCYTKYGCRGEACTAAALADYRRRRRAEREARGAEAAS